MQWKDWSISLHCSTDKNNTLIFRLGSNTIDLNVLSYMCDEIEQTERAAKPLLRKHFHLLSLPLESETWQIEHRQRVGRFIGKKGGNLHAIQEKYDVRVHLINRASTRKLLRIQAQDRNNTDNLQLVVMSTKATPTNTIPTDEIKEEIMEKWNETSDMRCVEKDFALDPTESEKPFQYMNLSFGRQPTMLERRQRIGRFIGRKGENLQGLQDKYHIFVKITNGRTNEKVFRKLIETQNNGEQPEKIQTDDLCLFIKKTDTATKDVIPMDKIKREIIELWNKANEVRVHSTIRIGKGVTERQLQNTTAVPTSSIDFASDQRWQVKKSRRKH